MLDPTQVEGFDRDEGNRRKSAEKHGVGQAEAEQVFFNDPLLLVEDTRHSMAEPRFHALGAPTTAAYSISPSRCAPRVGSSA